MDLILYITIGTLVYVYAVISGVAMRELTDDPSYDLIGWTHISFVVFMSVFGGAFVIYDLIIKCLNWLNLTFQLRFWYQWYFTSKWDNLSDEQISNWTRYCKAYLGEHKKNKPPFFWNQAAKLVMRKYNISINQKDDK